MAAVSCCNVALSSSGSCAFVGMEGGIEVCTTTTHCGGPALSPPRSDSCAGTEDDIEDGVAEGYCGVPPFPSIYRMHSISNNAPLLSLLTKVLMTNLSLIRTMHTLY